MNVYEITYSEYAESYTATAHVIATSANDALNKFTDYTAKKNLTATVAGVNIVITGVIL